MRTFVSTEGCKFSFLDVDEQTQVCADGFPTFEDLRELLDFVEDMRIILGPQVVAPAHKVVQGRDWLAPMLEPPKDPLFLVHGVFFRVEVDESIPRGEIHYVAPDGTRTTLRSNDADVDAHGIAWG